MNTPELIQTHRKAAKISQVELAKKLNLGQSTISGYETGETDIPLSRLHAIADAIGIEAIALLPGKTFDTQDVATVEVTE